MYLDMSLIVVFLLLEHVAIPRARDAPRLDLRYPHPQLHEPASVRARNVPTAPLSGQLRSGAAPAPYGPP